MGHQQPLDLGGGDGDGALDGIRVKIDHLYRFARFDDLAIHGDQIALGLTIFIVEPPRHFLARDDGLAGRIRALHLGLIGAIRQLDRHQFIHTAEHRVRSGGDEILAHAVGIKMSVLIELHVGDLPLVQAIGGHQLDIGLACGIQCLTQALGATG